MSFLSNLMHGYEYPVATNILVTIATDKHNDDSEV